MSNFSHLEGAFPRLFNYANDAEDNFHTDQQVWGVKIRTFGSQLEKLVCKDLDIEFPPKANKDIRLKKIKDAGLERDFPIAVIGWLDLVRRKGNLGVHKNPSLSKEDIKKAHEAAFNVSKWFFEKNSEKVETVNEVFRIPKKPIKQGGNKLIEAKQKDEVKEQIARDWKFFWDACNQHFRKKQRGYKTIDSQKPRGYINLDKPQFNKSLILDVKRASINIELVCGIKDNNTVVNVLFKNENAEKLHIEFQNWVRKNDKTQELKALFPEPDFAWLSRAPGKQTRVVRCAKKRYSDVIDLESETFQADAFEWYVEQLDNLYSIFEDLIE